MRMWKSDLANHEICAIKSDTNRSRASTRSDAAMQAQEVSMAQAPPAFPKLPKSALFSKLQSFLPVMEQENKKLEQAMAAGDSAKHSIEVDEDDAAAPSPPAEPDADSAAKPPVIEMNFALGIMEDEQASDDDGDDDDLKAAIFAAAGGSSSAASDSGASSASASLRDLKLAPASIKPRPMIQELN